MMQKIEIENRLNDLYPFLGSWATDANVLYHLRETFLSREHNPYPYIIIDSFLNKDIAQECTNIFPNIDDSFWHVYCNPIEVKFANNKYDQWPTTLRNIMFSCLQNPNLLNIWRFISGIDNLENDPYMHGAGLHCHGTGGKLDLHLDYGIHPITGKERRLNLILYLNEDWKEEYGGDLQLWNADLKGEDHGGIVKKIYPFFNRAILFRTSDTSYHGMPDPLSCPFYMMRKSIALYYVSDKRKNMDKRAERYKAHYIGHPLHKNENDQNNAFLRELRQKRKQKCLTDEDTQKWRPPWKTIFPKWFS